MGVLNLAAFGARPARITDEQVQKFREIGARSIPDLIEEIKHDNVPYNQQDICFNILAGIVHDNPSLIDSKAIESILGYFPTSYYQKEVTLVARECPEVFKEELGQFIRQGNNGCINDTRDLVNISKNLLGEKFFQDEEVVSKFDGNLRVGTIKAMMQTFSDETFETYLSSYLKSAQADSIVHLVTGTTVQNELGLEKYLPQLMEACDVRDRKALFEIALIGSNTNSSQIAECLPYLRREDLSNVIYELLNKEVNLETVLMLGYSPEDLEEYHNKLASRIDPRVKAKLCSAIELVEEEIFPDSDEKALRLLDSKHYQEHYAKLQDAIDEYSTSKKHYFIPEDKKLLAYNLENITQILSGEDKPLKHKQLINIIEHEELIKNQIGMKRIDADDVVMVGFEVPKVSRDTAFTEAEKLMTDLEEDMVSEFYDSIGIDNHELSVNETMRSKSIRYGVEIEEIGVTTNDFMDEDDYIVQGFKTTSECSLRNYRKDYEQSIPFGTDNSGSEYVSDILSASSIEDLTTIKYQMEILKGQGAHTNFSCGMHIHVSSPETLDDKKDIATKMTREFKYVQDAVLDNFEVYPSRLSSHCKKIQSLTPEYFDRFRTVNMASLDRHGSIEFRFFNLPDALDMKVLESYIDFATCYYAYVESDKQFKGTCLDFIKENSDWLGDAPTALKSQAIFSRLCEDIEVKDSTKKVLGRLPEIFDFYTAVEPEHPERYESRNVTISDELKGITKLEEEEEELVQSEFQDPYSREPIDELFEDALYEIAEEELMMSDDEYQEYLESHPEDVLE